MTDNIVFQFYFLTVRLIGTQEQNGVFPFICRGVQIQIFALNEDVKALREISVLIPPAKYKQWRAPIWIGAVDTDTGIHHKMFKLSDGFFVKLLVVAEYQQYRLLL